MSILGNPITLGGGSKVPDFTYTGNWEWYNEKKTILKLKTSGVLVLNKDCNADVFVVGGGASGAGSRANYSSQVSGGGGGGGYTKTQRVSFTKDTSYPAVIGAGGASVSNNDYGTSRDGNVGGETSINGVSASGGQKGTAGYGGSTVDYWSGAGYGGNGGSGGGASYTFVKDNPSNPYSKHGYGGSDGGNGETTSDQYYTHSGGTGQGTTTRAFGEPTGELFAGGGGGGSRDFSKTKDLPGNGGEGGGGNGGGVNGTQEATSGKENTGGGGGGVYYYSSNVLRYSGAGGSGVILIRFA